VCYKDGVFIQMESKRNYTLKNKKLFQGTVRRNCTNKI